jgi:C4-type Zn-finger protein
MNENIAGEGNYFCPVCGSETRFIYMWVRRSLEQTINFERATAIYGLCCQNCQTPITEY